MVFKSKFENIVKFCKFIFVFVILINTTLISKLHASSFEINEIDFGSNLIEIQDNKTLLYLYFSYEI